MAPNEAAGGEKGPTADKRDLIDAALRELDSLVGPSRVKREVRMLAQQAQIAAEREHRGLKSPSITRHLVMVGKPGLGKAAVTRLLAEIYAGYGLLERPDVNEVTRNELVGEYIGMTGAKTTAVFEKAVGGGLLVQDAYSLMPLGDSDFARDAIDTLVVLMERYGSRIHGGVSRLSNADG